jgi:hypothetical protein
VEVRFTLHRRNRSSIGNISLIRIRVFLSWMIRYILESTVQSLPNALLFPNSKRDNSFITKEWSLLAQSLCCPAGSG